MGQQLPSNLPLGAGAFVYMQCFLDGVKQADGGIALVMASTDQMIKHAHSGE
jgi:hypothetical protein